MDRMDRKEKNEQESNSGIHSVSLFVCFISA